VADKKSHFKTETNNKLLFVGVSLFGIMNFPGQHINSLAIAVVLSWVQPVFIHSLLFFGVSYSDCCIVPDAVVFG
jgi:hypothetical protein